MGTNFVRHVNLTDEADSIYCYAKGDITPFDGPFVASNCWSCPLLCGLAGGYGVECCYQDDNVGKNLDEVTFRNSEDARDNAPETKDVKRVASPDGKKCAEMREKMSPPQKETANKIKEEKDKKAQAAAAGSDEAVAQTTEPVDAAVAEPATKSMLMEEIVKAMSARQ